MKFAPVLALLAHASLIASPAGEKPTMEEFMGINGHTVKFKPELYRPVCKLVRDYHPVSWDLGKDTSFTPPFPFAANRVSWEQVYGSWVKGGWTVDACLMFEDTPREKWKDLAKDSFAYGKSFSTHFGPDGKFPFVESAEIGNEPGKFTDADYRIVFENMAKGLRAGNAKLKIATCNLIVGKSHNYAKSVDSIEGLEALYDVLNIHVYAELKPWPTWERSHPEDPALPHYSKDVLDLCAWRDKHAVGKPIWITEFGYDASTKKPENKGDFAKWIGNTDEEQALWNVRSWLMFSSMSVDRAYVYFFDDQDQPQLHGSSGLTRNSIPKPAFWAAAHLQKVLGKFRFARVVDSPKGTSIYEYSNGAQSIWAAWVPTREGKAVACELPLVKQKIASVERLALTDGPAEMVTPAGNQVDISGRPVFIHLAP